MNARTETTQVLIVGAGPAGSVAAALLRQQGRQVLMLEKQRFPRFSIGESLLPQSMEYLEQAGMLRAVVEGIAFNHRLHVDALREGLVQEALPDLPHEAMGIYAVYPPGRFTQPKVRAFIDFLARSFADQPMLQ